MTHTSPIAARSFRRNWLAFFGDYVFFGLGLTFASTSVTMPAFARALTDNKVLIGAVSSVWLGGWLLPQVLAANFLSNKPHKYPIMMWGEIIGRPVFPLFVVWLLLGGVRFPMLTLFLFLGMLAYFAMTDALVALAWFDLMGKALAAETRGRLIVIGQVVTGLAAVGVGAWIRYLLSPDGPPFPMNYTIIFGLASLCYGLSLVSCAIIVEPPEAVMETRPVLGAYLPQLARLLRTDTAFSRITLVRLLSGLSGLATPFYVVYATEALRLPASAIGLFAGANTVGVAIAGMALGLVADRKGSYRVVQITSWLSFGTPLLALLMQAGGLGKMAAWAYPLIYVLLGMADGSVMLDFLNFVLEIAPPGQRPTYMGLTNTLAGLLILVPMLGGFLLQWTSYSFLFALATAGALAGVLVALRLPNPRAPNIPLPPPESEPGISPAP
ncbi:MAG: MFS transporter, partial [Chloroflexi bacterium]|nr:MFS transporter [Chloroflexota bacterium]